MSDFFPENKAQAALKDSQQAEDMSNDLDSQQVKELKGMSKLLDKLQRAAVKEEGLANNSAKGNFELIKVMKEIQDKEAKAESNPELNLSFSDTGQASLDLMKDIAKASLDADQSEQKILKDELVSIKDFIKGSVANPEESQALFEINKSIMNGVKANSTLLAKFSDGMLDGLTNKLMPALVGTVATVFSDSPIIGILAGLVGEGTRRAFEKRQASVKERKDRARFRLEKLSEAHTKRLVELQELKTANDNKENAIDDTEEETQLNNSILDLDLLAETIGKEFAFQYEDLIQVITDGLKQKFEDAGIDLETMAPPITSQSLDIEQESKTTNNKFERESSETNFNSFQKDGDNDDFPETGSETSELLKAIRAEIERGNTLMVAGKEEARRESKIERDELLSAITNLKGSGLEGNDEEGMEGLMEKLDFLGLGGIFTGIGVIFARLATGAKTLFGIAKKVFLPITAIVSAFSGVQLALDEFAKSGSILKSLGVGLQETGSKIIEIFTFGLLDAEKIGGFLRDVIPTSISDSVFRAVDWVTELFSDPLGALKSAGSGLIDMMSNAISAPFIAIGNFFGEDFKKSFSDITDFLGSMSDTVYEWVASIIPDFIPNALIPNSILKYKDSQAAAEVATDEYNELSKQVGESTLITPQMLLELQKAQQKMQESNIKAIKDQIANSDEPIALDDPRFEEIKKFEKGLIRTKENQVHSQRRIDQIENPVLPGVMDKVQSAPSIQASEVISLSSENNMNPVFTAKTDKINLASQIDGLRRKIEDNMKAKEDTNAANMNIASNQSVVNNLSSTHVNKQTFNSDPSIMRPILN